MSWRPKFLWLNFILSTIYIQTQKQKKLWYHICFASHEKKINADWLVLSHLTREPIPFVSSNFWCLRGNVRVRNERIYRISLSFLGVSDNKKQIGCELKILNKSRCLRNCISKDKIGPDSHVPMICMRHNFG